MKRLAFAGFAALSLAIAAQDVHAQSTVPATQQSFGSSLLSGVRQSGQDAVNQSVTNTRSNLENRASSYSQNVSAREKAVSDKVNGYKDGINTQTANARNKVSGGLKNYQNDVATRRENIDSSYKAKKSQLTATKNATKSLLGTW